MRKLFLSLAACATILSTSASGTWQMGSNPFTVDTLYHSTIGPGMTTTGVRLSGADENTNTIQTNIHYTTIDLTNPNLEIRGVQAKDGGNRTESVLAMGNRKNGQGNGQYLAGVNADFFNIGTKEGSIYTYGHSLVDGTLYNVGVGDDSWNTWASYAIVKEAKDVVINTNVKAARSLTFPDGQYHDIHVNGDRWTDYLVIYTPAKGESTGTNIWGRECQMKLVSGSIENNDAVFEITSEVIGNSAIGSSDYGNMAIPADGFVLSGIGDAYNMMGQLKIGDRVSLGALVTYQGKEINPTQVLGGCSMIVIDGKIAPEDFFSPTIVEHFTSNQARSVVGYNKDRTQMIILVADKYTSVTTTNTEKQTYGEKSTGMALKRMGQIMLQLGCYTAMNFDGGGSSQLYNKELGIRNTPYGGDYLRPVANGLFVVDTTPVDNEVAMIEVYQKNVKLANGETFTPTVYGYNKYGVLVNPNIGGYTLIVAPSMGSVVGGTTFTAGDATNTTKAIVEYNGMKCGVMITTNSGEDYMTSGDDEVEVMVNAPYSTDTPNNNIYSYFTYSNAFKCFEIGINDRATLTLSLENADLANGFQTDITLPAGLSIAETAGKLDVYFGNNTAAESHVLSASKVAGENKYRIVAYSSKNEVFKSGENLLNINIVSGNSHNGGEITLDNTVISLSDDSSCNPDAVTITVPDFIGVKTIVLDPSEASINLGSTLTITAEVGPANAWVKTLSWTSSDENVATVNEEGVVTPVGKGVAIISATATDGTGTKASATITVTNYMQSLSIGEDITIELDETVQLNPVFAPTNADATDLQWSSSDAAVAYVDSDNVLHALSAGTATIIATNLASGLEASITVTVGDVLYGDANDNGVVAIDDVVTDVQYILEKNPTPFNFKKADVNRDKTINIIDVSKTVGIILTSTPANAPHRAAAMGIGASVPGLNADDVTLTASRKTMTISLGDWSDITALQGDIEMPEGVSITAISLAGAQKGDHIVEYAQLNDRCVRFAVYSLSLATINGNAPMLEFALDYDKSFLDSNAEVYGIMASDIHSNLLYFDSFGVNISNGDVTGIDDLLSDNGCAGDVYTLQGICVMRDATQDDINTLAPGIYIVRQGESVKKIAIY